METETLEHLASIANRYAIQWWQAPITIVDCAKCGEFSVEHDSAHADAHPYCPSCEKPATVARDTSEFAWWWWTCSPGCLPDSDMFGPFETQREALENATEGLGDNE